MKVNVSITKRGPTSWRVRTRWRENPQGLLQEVNETIRGTRARAEAHRALILEEFHAGKRGKVQQDSVSTFLRGLVKYRLTVGAIRPSTADNYRIMIGPFLDWFGDMLLTDLTPDACQEFVLRDAEKNGLKHARQRYTIIKGLLGHAVRQGKLNRNPFEMFEAPRVPHVKKKVEITETDMARLFEQSYHHDKIGLALRLALATGARRGELAALQFKHLKGTQLDIVQTASLVSGKVTVGPPKTPSSVRLVSIPAALADEIRRYEDNPENFILTGTRQPMRPDTVSCGVARIMQECGIDGLSVHDLRHAHATYLLQQGVPIKAVSDRLGHSKVSTTLDIYAHALPKDDARIVGNIQALMGPGCTPVIR